MFLMYAMLPFLLYNPVDEKKLASRVSLSSLSSGVIEECTVGAYVVSASTICANSQ